MRLAILGSTSQIAKDLILAFTQNRDHDLVLYARRPEAVSQWLNSVGLAKLYVADITTFSTNERFDAILNFVGVGDPAQAVTMGAGIFDVTLKYDEMALDYLRQRPDCRYIFLSSGAVYGESFDAPVDEHTKAVTAINNLKPQEWYGVAKLHAECRHRALAHLPIVDLRVFNYFSHTQDMEARFFITDTVRAIRDKTVLKTSRSHMVRDYLHPSDLHALVSAILASPAANEAIDCRSKGPIEKMILLAELKKTFGLQYEIVESEAGVDATGSKAHYYSKKRIGFLKRYSPNHDSLSGVMLEMKKIMNKL